MGAPTQTRRERTDEAEAGDDLPVTLRHGTAFVTATGVRNHFSDLLETVLPRYNEVVITKRGDPICVLLHPTHEGAGRHVEEF